jgi:SAM-dependent methyltransferase
MMGLRPHDMSSLERRRPGVPALVGSTASPRGRGKVLAGSFGKRQRRRRAARLTARTADKHELYQLAVQSPREDLAFVARLYRTLRGRNARHLREDFCGTGLVTATWVRRGKAFTAEGFDLCADTIAWGLEHNFAPLGAAAARATIHQKDVRSRSRRAPDIRVALNFSYFVFKTRKELVEYFRAAARDLAPRGIFVLDIYGGAEAMEEMEDVRRIDRRFSYVWEQAAYVPATGEYRTHIHFRFADGSRLRRAFSYDWRLWTLPEVKDALLEAGFTTVDTYWEGDDETGTTGNGVFRKSNRGENCAAWVTYLVAYR